MIFTTKQAADAIDSTPVAMRKIRERRGLGHELIPGRTGWTFQDMEEVRRRQGLFMKSKRQYSVRYTVKSLKGDEMNDYMTIWADSKRFAQGRASTWFWNAELKEHPSKYGVPVSFKIDKIREV